MSGYYYVASSIIVLVAHCFVSKENGLQWTSKRSASMNAIHLKIWIFVVDRHC